MKRLAAHQSQKALRVDMYADQNGFVRAMAAAQYTKE